MCLPATFCKILPDKKSIATIYLAGAWKSALWGRMEALMDTLLGKCAQVDAPVFTL
jgi:hypothetical protein